MFSRRVSFNNLDPQYNDVDFHAGPSAGANGPSAGPDRPQFNDINFGYGASVINDLSYYDQARPRPSARAKRKKLSPAKSILKNKLSPQQLQYNVRNSKTLGINYHETLEEIAGAGGGGADGINGTISSTNGAGISAIGASDSDSDDEMNYTYGRKISSASQGGASQGGASASAGTALKPAASKLRRKSYSDMTDQELMALDPQFANTKSKIDQFKFDNHKTYYLPAKKQAVPPKLALNKVDAATNYKSINLTYKHDEFRLNRTVLAPVSGRAHTWTSLYWLIHSDFLQDGDYVIVSSLISPRAMEVKNPSQLLLEKCTRLIDWFLNELASAAEGGAGANSSANSSPGANYSSSGANSSASGANSSSNGANSSPGASANGAGANSSANASTNGANASTNGASASTTCGGAGLRLKVTVEFIIDESLPNENGNKPFFSNLFHQYNPNLLVISNKSSNLNFKYPIKLKEAKSKFLVKFSSFLVKYSTIPVVILNNGIPVPGLVRAQGLGRELGELERGGRELDPGSLAPGTHKDSIVSMQSSNSSITSDRDDTSCHSSDSAHSSYDSAQGTELYTSSFDLNNAFGVFETMIKRVSDKSLKESREYLQLLEEEGSPQPYRPQMSREVSPKTADGTGPGGASTGPGEPDPSSTRPLIKFDPAVNFSATAGAKNGRKSLASSSSSRRSSRSKIHSIYTSQLSRQSSLNSEMYKVKSLIDSNSTENVSSKSLKSVKSNDSGLSGSTRHPSTTGSINGGMTTKMIKSGLKKEAEKPKPKAKKSVWKRIFS